jgi:hypothetical protein
MLKAMAATAAGAAVSATGLEQAFAANTATPSPADPFASSTRTALAVPSIALAPGNVAMNYMGQEFRPGDTTFTYTNPSIGAIQGVAGATGSSYYKAPVKLPNGVIVTQVVFFLIVNDANPAQLWFNGYTPATGVFAPLNNKPVSTTGAAIQTIDMAIPPQAINANDLAWALYWFPGTNGPTHQLYGARVAWMLNPGLTLFPDPRRIVNGGLLGSPFVNGNTYGPIDAKLQFDLATATGIPAGAKAAFCAVQSYTPGVLTLFPDLATDPGIANYSGTGTQGFGLNMVYMMVPLSAAGKFKIHSYISGNCYVDAWGYVV